jgi:cysteinyl-tRNA synthetase
MFSGGFAATDAASAALSEGRQRKAHSMQLYNSLSGRKETFTPADPGRPTMYVCGPTVYNHPHIGNARPAVVFDVLFRLLKHRFGDVLYVRNVTDIEDRIMAAAEAEGVATEVIARRYAAAVEVAPYKRDPADFVLWKPSSPGQPGWDSPWGLEG